MNNGERVRSVVHSPGRAGGRAPSCLAQSTGKEKQNSGRRIEEEDSNRARLKHEAGRDGHGAGNVARKTRTERRGRRGLLQADQHTQSEQLLAGGPSVSFVGAECCNQGIRIKTVRKERAQTRRTTEAFWTDALLTQLCKFV